jgi:hypothetical protein
MIGATTTVGLSPTGIDGDNFDVFSSLRDGADGEEFSSGVGDIGKEVDADTDETANLDLVTVASGKEKLDTFMDDSTDLKDIPAPVDALSLASKSEINSPENWMSDERRETICQGVASVACASCVARDDCPILRMRNFASENLQPAPGRESYLSELLNDNDDDIVVAGYVNSSDSEANTISTKATEVSEDRADKSNEQMVSQEQERKALTNETVESLGADVDTEAAEIGSSSKKVVQHVVNVFSDAEHHDNKQPTSMRIEVEPIVAATDDVHKVNDDFAAMAANDVQASPQIEVQEPGLVNPAELADSLSLTVPVEVPSRETPSHNTTADDTGDYNNSHDMVSEVKEKSALPAIEQELSAQVPELSADIQTEDVKRETPAKEIIAAASMPVKKQFDQPVMVPSPIQNSVEHGEEALSVGEESAVDDTPPQPAIVDAPAVYEAVEVVPRDNAVTEREVIDVKPSVATAGNEDELQTELPQDGDQEAAVDQTIYETQLSPVEQFDDVAIEKRSCDSDEEVWAEEDVVFFVEQPSAVEPEIISLAEVVAAESPAEATIVTSEEIDEPEVFMADEVEIESIEPLDNLQVVSVPEIIKDDYEPVEQLAVSTLPTIKLVPIIESKEAPVQALEKYGLPREKQDNVITTTPEGNGLWLGGDEPEVMAMDGSDAEQNGNLFEEQENPVVIDRVAEVTETELSEQNDLMDDDAADKYDYSSEVNVADEDSLIIKNHPSLGLWMDDSRLNPEDNRTPATSSTSVISWLTKLVGVVAVYVVYNRRDNKVIYN